MKWVIMVREPTTETERRVHVFGEELPPFNTREEAIARMKGLKRVDPDNGYFVTTEWWSKVKNRGEA